MRLNQRADYGLAAVLYLAQKKGDCRYSLAEICQATEIPEEFLRKIFQALTKADVIKSFKGKGGGVSLARSPENITVFQVIESLEEKGLVRCMRGEYCPRSDECVASDFWNKVQKKLFEILKRTSIKDLLEEDKIPQKVKTG